MKPPMTKRGKRTKSLVGWIENAEGYDLWKAVSFRFYRKLPRTMTNAIPTEYIKVRITIEELDLND